MKDKVFLSPRKPTCRYTYIGTRSSSTFGPTVVMTNKVHQSKKGTVITVVERSVREKYVGIWRRRVYGIVLIATG